jgi:hypothetical protein
MSTERLTDMLDYKDATDGLLRTISAQDLADEIGCSKNAILRARLDSSSKQYRPPPAGWQAAVVKLARFHGGDLLSLADELDRTT